LFEGEKPDKKKGRRCQHKALPQPIQEKRLAEFI